MSYSRHTRLLMLLAVLIGALTISATSASSPPYSLPMAGDPSPSTWYVSQWYGNTVWAARNAEDVYPRGQGVHFGVDFAAPCGTAVYAIGDGVVFAVDGPYGSAPHNVVIDHGNDYYSLYGHLQVRSSLSAGQPISRGDRVGQVGDPAGPECVRAPHLHLEIRRSGMTETVNPVPLIDADWRLLTIGAQTEGSQFAVDFANPTRWQTVYDQPDVRFGGPRLNDYQNGWIVR